MWVDIKREVIMYRTFHAHKKITRLKLENCHLNIDENLFINLNEPQIKDLIFERPGWTTFSRGSLNMPGNTTITFQNQQDFRMFHTEDIFNQNVTQVILKNLRVHDFASDFFGGLGPNSNVHFNNCHIFTDPDSASSQEIHLKSFVMNNVTLHPSTNVKTFLRFRGLKEAIFSNLKWHFDPNHFFRHNGIVFQETTKLIFEDCNLLGFRAMSGDVTHLSFKR